MNNLLLRYGGFLGLMVSSACHGLSFNLSCFQL